MTGLDLDAIRARAQAATPGPWWPWDRGVGWQIAIGDGLDEWDRPKRLLPEGQRTDIALREDAEFIAAARQDIPALLAEVERLRAEVTETTQYHQQMYAEAVRQVEQLHESIDRAHDALTSIDDGDDDCTTLESTVERVVRRFRATADAEVQAIAEADAAHAALLATRQMANDTNARLRDVLLAALGLPDDGTSSLDAYVRRLIEQRDRALTVVGVAREWRRGDEGNVNYGGRLVKAVDDFEATENESGRTSA